jgi:hypothetical protein
MKKTEIIGIIKDSLVDYFESIDESIELNEEIILFGKAKGIEKISNHINIVLNLYKIV